VSALEAIVLGIVQGLTEFLPISSTAHLRIVPAFAGWEDPGAAFTGVTQLGTMAAVLLYFRHDLWRIAGGFLAGLRDREARRTLDFRLGLYIILGTIPIGVFGLIFSDEIETGARNLTLIGCALIALGLLLLAAEKVASHTRELDSLTMRDGMIIGFAQACALVPGVSRSGGTLTAGLFLASSGRRRRATRSCCPCPPSCSPASSSCVTSAKANTRRRCRPRSPRCARSSSATRRSLSCCAG
jgi:undecaprenyl-diphosphatase